MKKKIKSEWIEAPKVPLKIMRQYAMSTGYGEFKMITVYSNFTIAVGSKQKLEDQAMLELRVKQEEK